MLYFETHHRENQHTSFSKDIVDGKMACLIGCIMVLLIQNRERWVSLGGKMIYILEVFARFGRYPGHSSFS